MSTPRPLSRLLTLMALLTLQVAGAAPGPFTDPPSYPASWPDAQWWPYTAGGSPLFDEESSRDESTGGTTPTGSVDLVRENAAHYYSDGTNAYLRFGLNGPPMSLSGSSQPFTSATWTVLMDTDGDGYREFAIMISGIDSSGHAQPDDIIVMYADDSSQALDPATQTIWRQDSARHPTDASGAGVDGEPGAASDWDVDPDEYVWDFGRTRITQRDRSRNPGSNNSTYWLDLQVPLAALDATSRGGPALTSKSIVRFVFSSANSNTNPAQKDFTFLSGYTFTDLTSPLPSGDASDFEGNVYLQPIITGVRPGTSCSASSSVSADVAGTLEAWGSGRIRTNVRDVTFYVAADLNANGVADDGQAWTSIGSVTMTTTAGSTSVAGGTVDNDISPWRLPWDATLAPRGQLLVKAVATNADGITTDSVDTTQASSTYNPATYGVSPVLGTFLNTCGAPLVTLEKTADLGEVAAGGAIEFTLSIRNPTSVPASLDSLTDHLPQGFSYTGTTGGTLSPTSLPAAGATGSVTWGFGPAASIAASSTATLVFTAQAASVVNTYSNVAEASTSAGVLTSNALQIGVGAAQLTLGIAPDVPSASPGQVVTFTLTYANDSPVNARDVVLNATLPTGMTYHAGGTLDPATHTVAWAVGDLPSGSGPHDLPLQVTVTDPYPAEAGALLTLPVSATSSNTAPASSEAVLGVNAPRPDLRLDMGASSAIVTPGSLLTLTSTYANVGTATATGVTLTSAIPAGFTYSSSTGGGTLSGSTVTWSLGTLAPDAVGSTSLTLQANDPYDGSSPQLHSGTLASAETSPATASVAVGVASSTCVATTWYFTRVPFSATPNEFTASTSAPTGSTAFDHTVSVGGQYPAWEPVLTIYQDPPNANEISLTTSIDTTFYMSKDNTPLDLRAELYDLDPATGTLTLLGASDADTNAAMGLSGTAITNRAVSFSVPLNGTLPKEHVLVWRFFGRTKNTNLFTFHMDGTASPSQSYYCVAPPADLVLDTSADAATATPGNPIVFTNSFGNAGQSTATNSELTVTLPSGVTFGSATLNGAAATPTLVNGQELRFAVNSSDSATPGQVTGGRGGELVVRTTLDSPAATDLGTLTTRASLESDQTVAVTDAVDVSARQPEVSITKSVDLTRLLPGETATYTISLLNGGTASASGITVRDVLPETAYYAYVSGSATVNGATPEADPVTAGTLALELGTLAPGATATVTFQMRVATTGVPDGVTRLASTASVADAETIGSRSSDEVAVSINSNPVLRIGTGISPAGPVPAGTSLTYTVTVENIGASTAQALLVQSTLPTQGTFVPGSLTLDGTPQTDEPDADGGHFDAPDASTTYSVPSLASGAAVTMTYRVQLHSVLPNGATAVTHTSSVSASNAATRTTTGSITAEAAPDLALVQSAPLELPLVITELAAPAASTTTLSVLDGSYLLPGDTISLNGALATVLTASSDSIGVDTALSGSTGDAVVPVYEYRLSYSNRGTADATDVEIDTTVPAGLEFLSASAAAATPSVGASGAVQWTIGSVPAGTSGSLTLQVRPSTSGTYTSSATIRSAETLAEPGNDVTVHVGMLRALKSTGTSNVALTSTGGQATYTITVENTLASSVADIAIADVLPLGFTYASTRGVTGGTCTSPAPGSSTPEWTSCSIPATTTLAIEFVVDIDASVAGGTYDNDVRVSSDDAGVMQFRSAFLATEDVTVTPAPTGSDLSGIIYGDANANHALDPEEDWTGGPTVVVNLVQAGSVLRSASVPAGSGAFEFPEVADGTYTVVVTSTTTSTAPQAPAGWLFLHPSSGTHVVTVAGADATGLNVGLFHGSRVTGTIFRDHGFGGGTPNDARRNGSEPGAPGVTLTATDGTHARQATTDGTGGYSLLVPAAWGTDVTVSHDAPTGTGISDDAQVLYAATAWNDPDATRIALDATLGLDWVRNFGTVNASSLTPDHSGQSISPGSVTYTHRYQPGTLGNTSLEATGIHRYEFFVDGNCDGAIDASEQTPVASVAVDASWPRSATGALQSCLVEVRVLVDAGQPSGRTDIADLTATLAWAGSSVAETRSATDTTVIRDSVDLSLSTRVRNISTGSSYGTLSRGRPGETLEYCTAFQNISTEVLTDVEVRVPVPFHTAFLPQAYGAGNDLMIERDGTTTYGTAANDGDGAELSGNLVTLYQGTLLPAGNGEMCIRTVIE